MTLHTSSKKAVLCLLSGLLGCLLMGGSDWLMIYGDPTYTGNLAWLTAGVAKMAPWRSAVALALAFPAVIFYGIALFGVGRFLWEKKARRRYLALTAAGMTPWIALHLFYLMILYLFTWLSGKNAGALTYEACEALFHQFFWLIPLGEVIILLPFLYWFAAVMGKKSTFSRWMALNNPLIIYLVLKLLTGVLPDTAARLAFVNGLMSESMAVWFAILLIGQLRQNKK